nr:hypothetical protein [Tanacetum cinerariifolium]
MLKEDASKRGWTRQTTWTNEEEIVLCKGWVYISKNNRLSNTRKDVGFWTEVLQYMESKTKFEGHQMYDMVLKASPKWMQSEVPKFLAKSKEGSYKGYKTSGSTSFNTKFGEASINLNVDVGDEEEDEVQEIQRPIGRDKTKCFMKKKWSISLGSSSMNDKALIRLMVSELAMQNEHAIEMQKEERKAFLEIKMRELECRE